METDRYSEFEGVNPIINSEGADVVLSHFLMSTSLAILTKSEMSVTDSQ